MRPDWHTRVVWRRGPLGSLHAQWRDEEIPGASCCSDSAALAGPDVGFQPGACGSCVSLALALSSQAEATCSVRPEPLDWRAMRETAARRRAQVLEAAGARSVTQQDVMRLCGVSQGAANMLLRKLLKSGALVRVAYGKYRAATSSGPAPLRRSPDGAAGAVFLEVE